MWHTLYEKSRKFFKNFCEFSKFLLAVAEFSTLKLRFLQCVYILDYFIGYYSLEPDFYYIYVQSYNYSAENAVYDLQNAKLFQSPYQLFQPIKKNNIG